MVKCYIVSSRRQLSLEEEGGFLFLPTLSEGNLKKEVDELREFVSSNGGSIISEEFPSFRDLSYSMDKSIEGKNQVFKSAFFGWIKFEISSEELSKIKVYN